MQDICIRRNFQRQTRKGARRVGGTPFFSEHNYIYPAPARRAFHGSVVTPVGHLESQDFRQHPPHPLSEENADRFGGFACSCGPDGILNDSSRGGGAVWHLTSSRIALNLQMSMWCVINLFLQRWG